MYNSEATDEPNLLESHKDGMHKQHGDRYWHPTDNPELGYESHPDGYYFRPDLGTVRPANTEMMVGVLVGGAPIAANASATASRTVIGHSMVQTGNCRRRAALHCRRR